MRHFLFLFLLLLSTKSQAQRTIGLTQHDADLPGYVLFSPMPNNTTYLIDGCGREVHQWVSTHTPGLSAQLQPDGTLLRTGSTNNPDFHGGGNGGIIERYGWTGDLIWSFPISSDSLCQHHDFIVLPNGNILTVAWEVHTALDAFALGLDTAYTTNKIWSERLIELHPTGSDQADVVWVWRAWDHLVQRFDPDLPNFGAPSDRPRRIDINYRDGGPFLTDWLHINSVSYNADRDEVMVSVHNFNEVWVIDHSTTTAEAAGSTGGASGHGGDLLYRWGNPMAYGTGSVADRKFHHQHHATWLPPGHPDAGKMMVFNNLNAGAEGNYSSVVIFDPPLDTAGHYVLENGVAYGPGSAFWTWTAPVPTDFYGQGLGGAFPVGDGFLFTVGPSGQFIGIDGNGVQVWRYVDPVTISGPDQQGSSNMTNSVFRCEHYAEDFPGFAGHDLTPGDEIELDPLPSLCLTSGVNEASSEPLSVHPNPAKDRLVITSSVLPSSIQLMDASGRNVALRFTVQGPNVVCDLSGIAPGVYTLVLVGKDTGTRYSSRLVLEP